MTDLPARTIERWHELATNRRVLAKAGALLATLSVYDFTSGEAQTGPAGASGVTRAFDWSQSDDPDAVIAASDDGFVTVQAAFPFTAVGASWSGDVGVWPLVDVQVSYDGSTFGELVTLSADADSGRAERDGRTFTRLLFANGQSILRFRTTDQNGVPVAVVGFGITFIDASDGPTLSDLDAVTPANITTPPAIISRSGWGADESLRFSNGVEVFPREYEIVTHAIIHHSETPNESDPLQQIRGIYYFHAITRGWGDIGYNYLVDKYGNVYEGRVGGTGVVGAHAALHNHGSAGSCLIGNHLIAAPTAAAVSGLVGILSWICRDLDPLGASDFLDIPNLATICGHRDVYDTTCPGDYAYLIFPSIRDAVAQTLANSPQSPPGGFVVGDLAAVATGDGVPVNLRSAPGTTGSIVTQLGDGIIGQITGNPSQVDGVNWYPISTFLGNGWISASYLELVRSTLVDGTLFVTGDLLAVERQTAVLLTAPRPSASVGGSIVNGTQAQVASGPRYLGGTIWYELSANSGASTGWGAQSDFVLVSRPAGSAAPAIGDMASVTQLANFRSRATTSASILGALPLGTECTVVGGPQTADGFTWSQLQTAYGTGWMANTFLRVTGSGGTVPTPIPSKFAIGDSVANPGALNLRSQPTTSGSVIALMTAGTIGTVLAGPTPANGYSWYQLSTRYGTGWAAGELLNRSTATPTPSPTPTTPPTSGFPIGSTVRTTAAVNLRSASTTSGSVLAVLPLGATGTVLAGPSSANGYAWYQLRTSSGTGWVAGSFLAGSTQPGGIQVGSSVRTTSGLKLRASASTSGALITTMPSGTRGTVIGGPVSANGYTWWQLQTSLGTGWAAGTYLALV